MTDKGTYDWLRGRALTVLAELMTSDDDQIALRAAETTLAVIRSSEATAQEEKENRFAIRYADRVAQPASGTVRSAGQSHPLSGSGLRAALGKDSDGEDRGA